MTGTHLAAASAQVHEATGLAANAWLLILFPVIGAAVLLLGGKRTNAWGHHASCSCAIGTPDENGVLSSDFRVHGVDGLRVVDASVFPRIPGFFIASAVYMVGEKAADVILAQSAGQAAA